MTPEGKVKAEIKRELKRRGWYFFMPVQAGFGAAGLDFFCCIPFWGVGRFVAIEAKRADGGVESPRQKLVASQIRAAGGISIVARSWSDVESALAEAWGTPLPPVPTP